MSQDTALELKACDPQGLEHARRAAMSKGISRDPHIVVAMVLAYTVLVAASFPVMFRIRNPTRMPWVPFHKAGIKKSAILAVQGILGLLSPFWYAAARIKLQLEKQFLWLPNSALFGIFGAALLLNILASIILIMYLRYRARTIQFPYLVIKKQNMYCIERGWSAEGSKGAYDIQDFQETDPGNAKTREGQVARTMRLIKDLREGAAPDKRGYDLDVIRQHAALGYSYRKKQLDIADTISGTIVFVLMSVLFVSHAIPVHRLIKLVTQSGDWSRAIAVSAMYAFGCGLFALLVATLVIAIDKAKKRMAKEIVAMTRLITELKKSTITSNLKNIPLPVVDAGTRDDGRPYAPRMLAVFGLIAGVGIVTFMVFGLRIPKVAQGLRRLGMRDVRHAVQVQGGGAEQPVSAILDHVSKELVQDVPKYHMLMWSAAVWGASGWMTSMAWSDIAKMWRD